MTVVEPFRTPSSFCCYSLLLIDFYIAPAEVDYLFLACANIPAKIFPVLVQSLTPVSYTHLDVYKRQDVLWGPSMSWSNQLVAMIFAASWIPAKGSGISNSAPSATVDGFNVRGLTAATASGPRSGYSALVCVCVLSLIHI